MNIDISKILKALIPVLIATGVSVVTGIQVAVPKAVEQTDELEKSTEAAVLEHARTINAHAQLIEALTKDIRACRADKDAAVVVDANAPRVSETFARRGALEAQASESSAE